MRSTRNRYDAIFKAKVALEAINGERTIAEIASECGVHPNQITKWKKQLLEEAPEIFSQGRKQKKRKTEDLESELYKQIGQLKVELDWLKKNLNYSSRQKHLFVEGKNREIPIYRQCELIRLSRSSYYYKPRVVGNDDIDVMHLIDEQYTKTPFYGIRRITEVLRRLGYIINHKRIARLMRIMGLEAIYPKPRLSKACKEDKKYPYLLRGLSIVRTNQVWSTDITYIRLIHGFVYLIAIMDWFSRYVLSWAVSNTLDVYFCIEAIEKALKINRPVIFNSDQGSQFTSDSFTGRLLENGIQISMDGPWSGL